MLLSHAYHHLMMDFNYYYYIKEKIFSSFPDYIFLSKFLFYFDIPSFSTSITLYTRKHMCFFPYNVKSPQTKTPNKNLKQFKGINQ